MTKVYVSALVASVAFFLLFAWTTRQPVEAQVKPAPAVPRWEYKVVTKVTRDMTDLKPGVLETEFDKLGAQGWELCASAHPTPSTAAPPAVAFVFKRPKR